MSSARDTPAHQDGNVLHVTPVRVGDQRHHPNREDGSEGGLEGKDDRAGHNDRTCQFDDQQCPARLQRKGEQHSRGDRVHTAGNSEEPAIQFGTDVLIGLQQHPGRRRHQHHGHDKEKPGECGDHPKDDHPYAVRSARVVSRRASPQIPCS